MRTHPYTAVQQQYVDAKATYEAACAIHEQELARNNFHALLDTADDEVLFNLEMAADAISHHGIRLDDFLAAEKALFQWGHAQSKKAQRGKKNTQEATAVDEMFADIHKYPHLKSNLADICLMLDVAR